MDFGTLLHTAQKNGQGTKKEIKYYSTKFEPPKKEQRSKTLSANIMKFLAKKEAEEKQKAEEARKRKEKLMELRSQDKKATRRVNVMLKRTKSANQSVLQEAVDSDNTAVTLAGPSQPDEDDYGYVSQSAADFYNKMMEKYSKMPDEPKFNFDKKKKVSTNLNSTKDRVKAALDREKEEASLPHRRKRKHKDVDASKDDEKEVVEKGDVYTDKREEKPKPKLKPAPVINFSDLLKIAEKKQFEPIVIEKPEKKEEERPLTKRQKREMEKDREYRIEKEKRQQQRFQPQSAPSGNKNLKPTDDTKKPNSENKTPPPKMNGMSDRIPSKNPSSSKSSLDDRPQTSKMQQRPEDRNKMPKQSLPQTSRPEKLDKTKPLKDNKLRNALQGGSNLKPKQLPSNDFKPKQSSPSDMRLKQFPPRDLKPKAFPPPDMRRNGPPMKRKPLINKGRIYDDDDEDYDSEMDDFIDDGPEGEEDYSKYISEIFGYDKRKYRYVDDDDDNMETSFAQQMKEEVISTKIGIMEDLEDMKLEEEQKKRKAIMMKKRK